MQKTVLEVLKTYLLYSAFWSAGQWEGYCPRPPGYATVFNGENERNQALESGKVIGSTVHGIV